MPSLSATVFLLIYGTELLVGITTNAFIVAVNLVSWAKGSLQSHNDQIQFALGLANLCVQGTSATAAFSFFFCAQLFYVCISSQVFDFFLTFSNFSHFCLTSNLLINYFIKMNHGTLNPFFRWMKMMHNHMPWLVCYDFVLAFVFGLMAAFNFSMDSLPGSAANLTGRHFTQPLVLDHHKLDFRVFIVVLQAFSPLLVTSISVTQLLRKIYMHMWHMKSTMNSGIPSFEAHQSAIRTMAFLLSLYFVYYLTWIMVVLQYFLHYFSVWFLVCMTIISILTSAQAAVFIMSNPKLKKTAVGILYSLKLLITEASGQAMGDISCVALPM